MKKTKKPPAPEISGRYRHRSNKRVCIVTAISHTGGANEDMKTTVAFKYERTGELNAPGLGWKCITPEQRMPLEEWQSFFTKRAEEKHG